FHNVGTQPFLNQSPPYSGQNNVVSFNYDSIKSQISANPGYLQLILTTNQGGGGPTDFDFDNFQLSTVPEPASCSVLALGAAGLLYRRRRN
ncbi:MAG TPA: PEP-CTERM sorting domain-containing protein, partial [Tepidisphaeraceae bacterium]